MDHDQAAQMQASARYVLGELTPAERDAFEEHYADCSQCLSDVELATIFAANTREVFRERALAQNTSPKGWAWLRWRPFPALAFSAALNCALVAGLGYGLLRGHNTAVTAVNVVAESARLESVDIFPVIGGVRGGPGEKKNSFEVSGRPIVLTLDLQEHYEHYLYSIDRGGSAVQAGEVSVSGQPDTLNVPIPASRLSPGEYRVTLTGTVGSVRHKLATCLLEVQTH